MRLLLDAHVSARAIGSALRDRGHDVLALNEHPDLEGLDDPDVLRLAVEEGRIVVTFDVKDFVPLFREWGEAGRTHAGCILVHGIDHRDHGPLLAGLDQLFTRHPNPIHWHDLAMVLPTR